MLQIQNRTNFQASLGLFPNEKGIDTVYAVVKATFDISPEVKISAKQEPVRQVDEYWGDPATSSIKYAGEMTLTKPATDVFLLGHAHAPEGKATEVDVILRIGERIKAARVFGDRFWKTGIINHSKSDPVPFEKIPMVWERAYGGTVEEKSGKFAALPKNPVGAGLWTSKYKEVYVPKLPNLEDLKNLIGSISDRPEPVCFAPVASHWQPRIRYAGTYDEAWQKKRMPFLPDDFDLRFFNSAPEDLIFSPYLKGGEEVEIVGASAKGRLKFRLPKYNFNITFLIAGQRFEKNPNLDTVIIEPDENRVCLVWRASELCDKKMLKVELVKVEAEGVPLTKAA